MVQALKANSPGARSTETVVTLQLLRGVAAVLVVFAHAIDYQQTFVPGHASLSRFYSVENFGAVGVDIFFVISGFIMAVIAPDAGDGRAAVRFAVKRIVRIVPIYWILTSVTALLAERWGSTSISLLRLISSISFIPLYPRGMFLAPIILVGWSLSFEMYFYLLIAMGLCIRKRGSVVPGVACIFAALALIGMMVKPYGSFAAFAMNPLLGEFALGCLIGHLYRKGDADLPLSLATGMLACGVTLLLGTIVCGFGAISEMDNTLMGDAGAHRLVIWGLPSALIVAGVVGSERRWRRLVPGAFRLVGDASYSIYLIELLALKQFAMRWSLAEFAHPDAFILAALFFAVLAGIAHYGIVEKPVTAWLSNRAAGLFENKEKGPRIALMDTNKTSLFVGIRAIRG